MRLRDLAFSLTLYSNQGTHNDEILDSNRGESAAGTMGEDQGRQSHTIKTRVQKVNT